MSRVRKPPARFVQIAAPHAGPWLVVALDADGRVWGLTGEHWQRARGRSWEPVPEHRQLALLPGGLDKPG